MDDSQLSQLIELRQENEALRIQNQWLTNALTDTNAMLGTFAESLMTSRKKPKRHPKWILAEFLIHLAGASALYWSYGLTGIICFMCSAIFIAAAVILHVRTLEFR